MEEKLTTKIKNTFKNNWHNIFVDIIVSILFPILGLFVITPDLIYKIGKFDALGLDRSIILESRKQITIGNVLSLFTYISIIALIILTIYNLKKNDYEKRSDKLILFIFFIFLSILCTLMSNLKITLLNVLFTMLIEYLFLYKVTIKNLKQIKNDLNEIKKNNNSKFFAAFLIVIFLVIAYFSGRITAHTYTHYIVHNKHNYAIVDQNSSNSIACNLNDQAEIECTKYIIIRNEDYIFNKK